MEFRLNPALDVDALARRFALSKRISILDFLDDDSALALHRHLRERDDWTQLLSSGEKEYELDRRTRAAMTPEQGAALDAAVYRGAREGYQHRYEAIRMPDDSAERAALDDPLADFALWLSSGETRKLLRRVCISTDIAFAEVQATAWSPGDFLTGVDDGADPTRRIAFTLCLTPQWRAEWGGLLLFHDAGGRAVQGLVPAFNALNLFVVPQLHSISMVTPAASHRHYAISGWLRSG